MTSASVKNTGFDVGVLPANAKVMSMQRKQDGQDFGTIMSQAKDKAQQESEAVNKPDTKTKVNKEPTQDKTKQTTQDTETTLPEDVTEDTVENVQKPMIQEEAVTDDVKEVVEEAVEGLMDIIGEELDVSEEELTAIMEQLGLQPIDLLQPQNLMELITEVKGADSVIVLLADEDMYQQLKNLTQTVETTMEDVMNQTGLSGEELDAVLQQLKILEEEASLVTSSQAPEQILEPAQPQNLENPISVAKPPISEEKSFPVVKTEEEVQVQPQTGETTGTDNMTEVSQINRKTEEDASQSEEETSDFQEGQNNPDRFQNTLNEAAETVTETENETVPTRSIDTESILKQLADYVKINSGKELTQMEMQLHPASLGTVHIQLATRQGVVTAQITTQNETVKNAIESQVVQLKENLQEQGIRVEAVEVSVASHQMEKNLDQNGQNQHSQEQNNKTDSIRRIRRANINLNLFNSEEEMLEEANGLDDAARIAMEMMAVNGNTMDLLA